MERDAELREVSRIHAIMAERMAKSWSEAPQFAISMDVALDSVLEAKQRLATEGIHASMTDFIVLATARALAEFPQLNACWEDGHIKYHPTINVGVAVAMGEELIVVVVRDADRKPIQELAIETDGLVAKARTGRFTIDDISGSTFTISNLGMFGVDRFTAILNPPEACILAVGSGTKRMVVTEKGPQERVLASFTLTTDHRVATGVTSAKFLGAVKRNMESIDTLLARP